MKPGAENPQQRPALQAQPGFFQYSQYPPPAHNTFEPANIDCA